LNKSIVGQNGGEKFYTGNPAGYLSRRGGNVQDHLPEYKTHIYLELTEHLNLFDAGNGVNLAKGTLP
jgi:hypothetical protein